MYFYYFLFQQQKRNVTDLQQAIKEYKAKHAGSLKELEGISEAIHQTRRQKLLLMYPRQPGVGAESDCSVTSSMSELFFKSNISGEKKNKRTKTAKFVQNIKYCTSNYITVFNRYI